MDGAAFDKYPHDGRGYSVQSLGESSGFYVCNGDPIYAMQTSKRVAYKSPVETECLRLLLGAKLKIVGPSPDGNVYIFDLIRLTDFQGEKELTAFIELCSLHASSESNLSFEDFFYSLNDMFQPVRKQHFLNAMGLYGELAVIDAARQRLDCDLSRAWQLGGVESKYDFAFSDGNLEVKTTTSQNTSVSIKHAQLFNGDRNYLVAVLLDKVPKGETLKQLADKLINSDDCFNDLRSQTALTMQLLRVDSTCLGYAYAIRDIRCYPAESVDPFGPIDERVSDLSYRLELANLDCQQLGDTLKLFLTCPST